MIGELVIDTTEETHTDTAALVGAFVTNDRAGFETVLAQIVRDAVSDADLAGRLANMFVDLSMYAGTLVTLRASDLGTSPEAVHRALTVFLAERCWPPAS